MANRLVSQLPENTEPELIDWLLGASGSSPSALQKIGIQSLILALNIVTVPTPGPEEIGKSVRWNGTGWEFFFLSLVGVLVLDLGSICNPFLSIS